MSAISTRFLILFLFISAVACGSYPADRVNWEGYSNTEYKFSIQHPADLKVVPQTFGPYFTIGEQIQIAVSDYNPLDCRGDCPVQEKIESVEIAGQEATRIQGYIGAIGGFIPQQYLSYVIHTNNKYYIFTLYAVGLDDTSGMTDPIRPLKEEDIDLFEQIMQTLEFIH
jgi:hypothetical protein